MALKFLNGGGSVESINQTFIVLIPKIKNIVRVSNFRPISLCNVLYKIIAKTIANRLNRCYLMLIYISQSGFVPEKLITDNAIIAFETF